MVSPTAKKAFCVEKGKPFPLGATVLREGVNFAVSAKHATSVTLCLFAHGERVPCWELELDAKRNRTGHIWHVFLHDLPTSYRYAYKADGPHDPKHGHVYDSTQFLLDPYARAVTAHGEWGVQDFEAPYRPLGCLIADETFDWQGVEPPGHDLKDLIVYELHVRGFTRSETSGVHAPGTYAGLIEKIPYLKELGINAIELMPIQEFNELEYMGENPETGESLLNYWGYSTVNFFSPMCRYAAARAPEDVVQEFKTLVRECHRHKIEVILDVVFNHTAEGNEFGPSLSFRGLDNKEYYLLDEQGYPTNYSGCGNTINANSPIVRQMIVDALRYWATEMQVDGFRFDLATILGRDSDGSPMAFAPLIDMISHDPVLANVKLIAEAWDAAGLYQVGSFYPQYGRWAEWNGRYRDDVRRFIKGTDGQASVFATRVTGSEDLYGGSRRPYHSLNFVTAHDGFSLRDLVSYNKKHNFANGEQNRDGCNENESWNCGVEGKTNHVAVLELRERQMRNFMVALFCSAGVPMLLMGDEYGHSKCGNNNTWCQDNALNWFDWTQVQDTCDLWRFCQQMIAFRKGEPLFNRDHFFREGEVRWLDERAELPDWDDTKRRFLAWELVDRERDGNIWIGMNAGFEAVEVILPQPPVEMQWLQRVNTAANSPQDIDLGANAAVIASEAVSMPAYSALVLKAEPLRR